MKVKQNGTTTFSNDLCIICLSFDSDNKARFSGRDLTDQNNMPACYNKTSRSWKKAILALDTAWSAETTMWGAMTILKDNGIKMHSYCQMD